MGKLGSRELTYGSDLDVIFLFDAEGADEHQTIEAQASFVRLSQKLGWALQTPTAEGVCYEVDARLRPSGNQGLLVTSLGSFERYHTEHAQVWERQALLRSRPVAGSGRLAEAFASRCAARSCGVPLQRSQRQKCTGSVSAWRPSWRARSAAAGT
jgi:glutamate-ammonia-ligase adenylyltransferase